MPDIITIGEILVEIMAEKKEQTFLRPGVFRGPFPSGAPAIFADQAARMGARCGMISRVGKDDFGRLNLKRLRADGVDVSHVTVDPDRLTGIAFVTYREDGDREFIYHFKDSAVGRFTLEEIDEEYLIGAKFLHIMGCTLLASPQLAQAAARGVELAVKHGVRVSFDPNIRPELINNKETRQVFDSILRQADLILTGAEELRQITGCQSTESGVAQLLDTADLVVVKNGSKDTILYGCGSRISVASYPVDEVDPTGAGDCFDGAFIASLVQGYSPEEAVRLGCAAGALAVKQKGPMEGAAWKTEIEALVYS